eukprot:1999141-Rhodomonas_salina.1
MYAANGVVGVASVVHITSSSSYPSSLACNQRHSHRRDTASCISSSVGVPPSSATGACHSVKASSST